MRKILIAAALCGLAVSLSGCVVPSGGAWANYDPTYDWGYSGYDRPINYDAYRMPASYSYPPPQYYGPQSYYAPRRAQPYYGGSDYYSTYYCDPMGWY